MLPHHSIKFPRRSLTTCALFILVLAAMQAAPAQKRRRPPAGGRVAIVVDERLAVLRDEPDLSAALLQRLGRGRAVAVTGARQSREGVVFYRVAVTRRTSGWLQREAVASPARDGDDARLLELIRASKDFDQLARARIFLDLFPRSPLRPAVLLLVGEAAETAAAKLSREAARRFDETEMATGRAPLQSYFMNYQGLDRYRRHGVTFIFNQRTRQFHYDGASWREIVRRFPRSAQSARARALLEDLAAALTR